MDNYIEFIKSKSKTARVSGFEVSVDAINPLLFDWQREVVKWALGVGKAALFEECGLGKTLQQLEWAKHVREHTGGNVLIISPLAVAHQTIREGSKLGLEVKYVRRQADITAMNGHGSGLYITNYDMLKEFDGSQFSGVVLDESSILKNYTGKTKQSILEMFEKTPYKLACTATPAPNDHLELGNHAQFLNIMESNEMIQRWFVNDSMQSGNYRLKKHGKDDFWQWVTSWAVCISKPSDVGFQDVTERYSFDMPKLYTSEIIVKVDHSRAFAQGKLFMDESLSATGMWREKRETLIDRCNEAAKIILGQNKLKLNDICGKMAVCGNQNTQKTEKKKAGKTLNIGKKEESKLSLKTRQSEKNICESIINKTNQNGKITNLEILNLEIELDAKDTQKTMRIVKDARNNQEIPEKEIEEQKSIEILDITSESQLRNTKEFSTNKTENVQFAEAKLQIVGEEDCTLTIATKQESLEDCSVQTAIQDLENLKIVQYSYQEQLNILNQINDFWIVWCDTDEEQNYLEKIFGDLAFSIRGSDSVTNKINWHERWLSGERKILISKVDIFGWGMNWQHCHRQVFVGLTYSFEKFYQALRRSWRFGQTQDVNAYLIYAESEGNISKSLGEKQQAHKAMQIAMNEAMKLSGFHATDRREAKVNIPYGDSAGKNWRLMLGDCVIRSKEIENNSIHFSVYSPPFANLYIYSDSIADMGNTTDMNEFMEQYQFMIDELFRVTMPGRLTAVHCKDLPLYHNRDGAAGLVDFPGRIIRAHEKAGWIFHSRITIWKDPVIEMQRTKNHGLLHKNFKVRAEVTRQGMADYVLVFRKWDGIEGTESLVSVKQDRVPGDYIGESCPEHYKDDRDYSIQVWQRYASPVWFDIQQTRVLNIQLARDNSDEKHICPLQLDIIARCVQLWTNKDETVLSPFAGIGSEGYEAIRLGRKFIGIELKESYFKVAVDNLKRIEEEKSHSTLFDMEALEVV